MQHDEQSLQKLIDDFERAGAWFDKRILDLTLFEGAGAGAIAKTDIPVNTPLFHIPDTLLLSSFASDLRQKLSDEEWEELGEGWSPLILVMMYETSLGSSSRWAFYLQSMPTTFETPMLWSTEELKELQGTDIEKRIGRSDAEEEYQRAIVPILQAHPDLFTSAAHFSMDAFHMHGSRILSRSFMIPVSRLDPSSGPNGPDGDDEDEEEEEEQVAVMVPMADMLNAAYERDNARLFGDHEEAHVDLPDNLPVGFTMVSTTAIRAGDQVYNTYASPPNSELLRKYGHVDVFELDSEVLELLDESEVGGWPFGNPGDEVELEGDLIVEAVQALRPDASLLERVDYWLEEGQEDSFPLGFTDSLQRELIAFIRILLFDEEWLKFSSRGKLPAGKINSEVLAILEKAVENRLSRYADSLQADLTLVKSDNLDERRKRAIIVRIGEKRLLHAALRAARTAASLDEPGPRKRSGEDGTAGKIKRRKA